MIPDWWCNPSPLYYECPSPDAIRTESILSGSIPTKVFGFRRFSRPFRVSFHPSLTLLLRYRSWDIFRFANKCLARSHGKTIPRYSGSLKATVLFTVTRLSRSLAQHFRGIHFHRWGRMRPTHHISHGFLRGFGLICSTFARRYSWNHSCFLFLPILKCFTSQRSSSHKGISRIIEPRVDVLLMDLGVYVYMRLTRAYRSLSRTSSVPKPRHSPKTEGVLEST